MSVLLTVNIVSHNPARSSTAELDVKFSNVYSMYYNTARSSTAELGVKFSKV